MADDQIRTTPDLGLAFVGVSPSGNPIMLSISPTPDGAWRILRESISDPYTLHDKGWRVGKVRWPRPTVELIEKIAKSLWDAGIKTEIGLSCEFEDAGDTAQGIYRRMAEAALAAMREYD